MSQKGLSQIGVVIGILEMPKPRFEKIDYNSLTEEDRQLVIAWYMNQTKNTFIDGVNLGFHTTSEAAENLYKELKEMLKF